MFLQVCAFAVTLPDALHAELNDCSHRGTFPEWKSHSKRPRLCIPLLALKASRMLTSGQACDRAASSSEATVYFVTACMHANFLINVNGTSCLESSIESSIHSRLLG